MSAHPNAHGIIGYMYVVLLAWADRILEIRSRWRYISIVIVAYFAEENDEFEGLRIMIADEILGLLSGGWLRDIMC